MAGNLVEVDFGNETAARFQVLEVDRDGPIKSFVEKNGLTFKAGRGFITNQPMLFFTVDGHQPGEVVSFSGRRTVSARAEVQSLLPFVNLEIVVNGREVATRTTLPQEAHAEGGVYSARLEATLDLDESAWIAARVNNDPDIRPAPLPRGLGVFAHTDPVYFDRDGRGVNIEASRRYLTKYVDGARHWFETRARFTTDSERQQALAAAAEARKVLAGSGPVATAR